MPFTDKDGHLLKALQKIKHYNGSQLLTIWDQIKPLWEKMINSVPFDSGRRPTHCRVYTFRQ